VKKLLFLLLPSALFALYLGSPAEPQMIDAGFFIAEDSAFSLKMGYEGDWVYNRKLKTMKREIDRFEILMNQGVMALGFLDRIEVYGSAGSFNAQFHNRSHSEAHEYDTHGSLTYGGGMRILLMQWKNTIFGVDGKGQFASPRFSWATVNGVPFSENGKLHYREWQVGLALSHSVDIFTPYIGAKYTNVHATAQGLKSGVHPHGHFKMVNRDRFGLAVGCSLSSGRIFDLTLEARMIDEQAFTGAGNIKF